MEYRLKENVENFTVTDGPLAGRKFEQGRLYDDIPPDEAHRFDGIPQLEETTEVNHGA